MNIHIYEVDEKQDGMRLDQFLKEVSGLTRSEVQKWIKEGYAISLPNRMVRSNYHISDKEKIQFSWEEKKEIELIPQKIKLDILYEDEHIIVINKSRGMVVHPGAGNIDNTLVNALLYHCGESLLKVGEKTRPGIVHRLDKDTSGVMVAVKSDIAYEKVKNEIATHEAKRTYFTLVHGQMEGPDGKIDLPLGRSLKDRMKWDVQPKTGKNAITHFHVLEFMPKYSLLECKLETGRTHQIRVHMSYIGHPVINDPLYGRKKDNFPIQGQALHSFTLELKHPLTGKIMKFEAPLPEDMKKCLEIARKENI